MNKLLVSLLILGALAGCNSGDNDDPQTFNFLVNVTILNPQSEYQVGDTLWMDIDLSNNTLTDRNTGADIPVDGALFGLSLLPTHFFDSDSALAIQDRLGLVASRAFTHPDANYPAEAAFTFGCPDNTFKLKIGVIFKDKGHFLFLLNRKFNTPETGNENPRTQVLIPRDGACGSQETGNADIGLVEYTFLAGNYNQAAFETFMAGLIADPANWDPASTQKTLNDMKVIFGNHAAFFTVVK